MLVTIMRASLPMWEGMLEVFERADNIFIGAARREGAVTSSTDPSLPVDLGYTAWTRVEGRTLIYIDPMIATGSTLRLVHEQPAREGRAAAPRDRRGRDRVPRDARRSSSSLRSPRRSSSASADDALNAKGYIVPGLGDAGDLAFGEKF